MKILVNCIANGHRVRPGTKSNMKYVTIHSTGNPKSSAIGERAWLDNPTNTREASWHYVVDADNVIQAIPETEVAWHAGTKEGNLTSIGIEICESGNREKTLDKAADLVADILQKHNWGVDRLKRHKDWSGKDCPRIFMDNNWAGWYAFIERVEMKLNQSTTKPSTEAQKASGEAWKLDGLKYLKENGLLNEYESWAAKVNDTMPVWAAATIMANIHKSLKK